MATLDASSIFLTITCGIILAISIVFNLGLLITLLKVGRVRDNDKSNYFLTHLILCDLLCTFFILIPSGVGVYNGGELDSSFCHVQTYFTTFNFTLTFHGLLLLAIDRYLKFFHRDFHDRTFLKETSNKLKKKRNVFNNIIAFIAPVWALDIFISFIPLFANFSDQKYFTLESQCDYIYENFLWWLWFYFFISIIIPFIAAFVIFVITLIKIRGFMKKIEAKLKQANINKNENNNGLLRDKAKNEVFSVGHLSNNQISDSQTTQKKRELFNMKTDLNDAKKTIVFFIILIVSIVCIFPLLVLHFYRAYNSDDSNVDDTSLIDWKLYTSFSWFSYMIFIVKSFICLVVSDFYRDAFYQAANCRGYRKQKTKYTLDDKKKRNVNDENK